MAKNAMREGRGNRAMEPQSGRGHLKVPQLLARKKENNGRREPAAVIQILPQNPSVPVGKNLTFTASKNGSSLYWESSDPTIAAIDPKSGSATGLKVGSVAITATGEKTREKRWAVGGLVLSVTTAVLESIDITASSQSIAAGTIATFTATGWYSDGTSLDITARVTWNSSNLGVAAFNAPGAATGVAAGSTNITASLSDSSGNLVTSTQSMTLQVSRA